MILHFMTEFLSSSKKSGYSNLAPKLGTLNPFESQVFIFQLKSCYENESFEILEKEKTSTHCQ